MAMAFGPFRTQPACQASALGLRRGPLVCKPLKRKTHHHLLWRVQFALKPASKALGGVFIRGKGLKFLIADSAFERMQVDAPGACWLDADEHHMGLALRTGGALDCSEWNDGRQALRLGHDASLEQAGAQHSLSPVMPRRRSGDCLTMRRQGLKRELIRGYGCAYRAHTVRPILVRSLSI
jgi:hypothetical protein